MTKERHDNRPDCIRKLLNIERFFLWHPLTMVALCARIKGNVSEERLSSAIDKARQVHPFLTCGIFIDKQQDAWFSGDCSPVSTLRVVKRDTDTMWRDELRNEYRVPFAHESGPLIRFVLLHAPEESELLIISSHVICDGMAISYLIRDILTFYAEPGTPSQKITPPVITDYISPGENFSFKKWIAGIFITRLNAKWQKNPCYFNHEDYEVILQACSSHLTPDFLCMEFDEDETESLLERCRENQVTMGSAMTAACLAAYHDIIGPLPKKSRTVSIPFDLRRHCSYTGADPFCFFVGGFQFSYTYNPKRSFWENASHLHHETEKLLKVNNSEAMLQTELFEPSLLDAFGTFALFHRIFPEVYGKTENLSRFAKDTSNVAHKLSRDFGKKMPGVIPTNLGRLHIPEQYGDLTLDRIWFLPTVNISIPIVLGGVSIGNRTTWTLPFVREKQYSLVTPENMHLIRDRALDYLHLTHNRSI